MNKIFLYVGLITLLFVAVAILTRPTETEYTAYLEKKEGIVCNENDFICVQKSSGENLQLLETELHNRVFFMTIEKTFQGEKQTKVVTRAFGIFHMFFYTSVERT